ncbi:MAG: nucleotidyltransferase domain-containing protein [Epsilonproteobacteria bacterium]|nr:nucleotidyltransferase domain-containing protein [Campylobacterota bacterium]
MQKFKMELLQQAKKHYADEGFNILGLFGSYARGDATSQSDIDILYELNDKFIKKYSGFAAFARLSSIKKELKTLFGIEVDIAAKSGLSRTAQKYIMKDLKYV